MQEQPILPISTLSKHIKKKPKSFHKILPFSFNRKLILSSLGPKDQLSQNQEISHIRMLDFTFPINSSGITEGQIPVIAAKPGYQVLKQLNIIKRCSEISYSYKTKTFIHKIEEKNPRKQAWKGYENYAVCIKLFLASPDPMASKLVGELESYIKYVESVEKVTAMIGVSDEFVTNCFVQEIKRSNLNYIKFFPYLMIRFQYALNESNGLITEIHINKKLVSMLKIQNSDFLQLGLSNLGSLQYFRSDNSVGFYCKLLNFISTTCKRSLKLESDEFYCVDRNERRIAGNFLLIKEKRISGGIPMEDIYFSYINDDSENLNDVVSSEDFITKRKKTRFTEKQAQTFKRLLRIFKKGLPSFDTLLDPESKLQESRFKTMVIHAFVDNFYPI